jgi:adenylate kinase family enzyme
MSKKILKKERIYVLGAAGSGKSFLTERLSKILKMPVYDMDDIRFIKKFTKVRSRVQRKKMVDRILKQKKWIFDARGTDWDRHAMLKADMIVWLLTPSYKRVFRILKRYVQRKNNPKFKEKFLDQFNLISYSLSFRFGKRTTSFGSIIEFIQKHDLMPIILKNNSQINYFLEDLQKDEFK